MPPAISMRPRDSWQQALDILDHLRLAAHAGWGAGYPDPDELRAWEPVGCGGRVLPPCAPDRASEAILGPRQRADNSGLSARAPPAETHKCTAFGLIYLQSRRS